MTSTFSAAASAEAGARPVPALEVKDLRISYGAVEAVKGISFTVEQGEFVTLLGPSGCGKTTTLRCIAGLESPSGGVIKINGAEVASVARQLSPDRRGINMVFQSYAVWPHLTVEQNVAYGLHGKKLERSEIRRRALAALELVGLEKFADRYGTELSGGQQQRVAVARATVTDPAIILFDEPLSNLDAGLRERMRAELLTLQRQIGRTAIYVTHDQSEAMAMSDKIILMNNGLIDQQATPRELYNRPRTRFAADFVGTTNVLEGTLETTGSRRVFREGAQGIELAVSDREVPDGSVVAVTRPEHIRLTTDTSSLNALPGTVLSVEFLGNRCDVSVEVRGIRFRIEAPASFDAGVGSPITVVFDPDAILILPATAQA
ncbi:ATP-binding cassette domain-containing protein [Microbacterium sp. SYP-A9085]|uniref:ABC transporter ATP-binding protein n=1 Tax=Microbacterium sp. SYP-A9085 TaxID=2664454 RepID=UPI00129A84E6|nr:ABC transporter ATP-binding protein [Microbacterium sp. SYP-A9085]MRH28510.1 ATP-binding cassette domain-containing protein [Microbacterium sp. SYP-A9085]